MLARDELAAWLRLVETPQTGPVAARRVLAAFGSPQAVFAASSAARRQVLSRPQADALDVPPAHLASLVETTWAWLQAGTADRASGAAVRSIVTIGDPHYPPALLETADPPLLLYAIGRTALLVAPCVAVVGSRNPTPQGAQNASAFAATLSAGGVTVVSGLALGIDGAAHQAALDHVGSTIAVVGTGLDRVYPKQHQPLARRIAEQGLLLSDFALGTPPLAQNFPRRNRLIAGLSLGTLVVEAAVQSGSLITARLATDAGRDVFAIPGSIHSPQSRGCHALIKQGAKLVETAADILDELRIAPTASLPAAATLEPADAPTGDPLLAALGFEPVTLDALCARLGEAPAVLSGRLLELELAGQIVRLPGQLFQRLVRA